MSDDGVINQVPVTVFESQVEEIEGITIVVRAPSGTMVNPYGYVRKSPGDNTVSEWLNNRINPAVGGFEVKIIDGEHESPRRSTKRLSTLRDSYDK